MVSLEDSGKFVSAASIPAYADDTRYAGFWIRTAAYIIDAILVDIALFVPITILGVIIIGAGVPTNDAKLGLGVDLIAVVGTVLYYMIFMASGWQATPGKKLLGLHVMRTDGRKIGLGFALGRYIAYIPSSLLFGVGFFMIGWNSEKKGLHDMICGTRVVHGKPRPRNLSTVFE
jgi:uncharacterized RDD family membrane protein YckC